MFILDSSGSVGQQNFYRVLNFTYSTIEGLNVDDGSFRIAIITFSDTSRLEFNLNDYSTKKDLKEGIRQVKHHHMTLNVTSISPFPTIFSTTSMINFVRIMNLLQFVVCKDFEFGKVIKYRKVR